MAWLNNFASPNYPVGEVPSSLPGRNGTPASCTKSHRSLLSVMLTKVNPERLKTVCSFTTNPALCWKEWSLQATPLVHRMEWSISEVNTDGFFQNLKTKSKLFVNRDYWGKMWVASKDSILTSELKSGQGPMCVVKKPRCLNRWRAKEESREPSGFIR